MVVPDYLSNWLGDVWVGNLRAIDSPASWNQFTTPTFQPRIWSIERLQLARVMTQTTEGCFRWAQTPCGVRRCKAQSWWAVVLRRQVCGLRWCRGAADSWAEKNAGARRARSVDFDADCFGCRELQAWAGETSLKLCHVGPLMCFLFVAANCPTACSGQFDSGGLAARSYHISEAVIN